MDFNDEPKADQYTEMILSGASDMETVSSTIEASIARDNIEHVTLSGLHDGSDQIHASDSASEDDQIKQADIDIIENVTEIKANEDLPIDKGWAWFVLTGATLYLIIFGGIKKNYGIVFVAIQGKFGSSASLTSLLATMQNLSMSFSSLVITTVGMQFISKRSAIIFGALAYTVGHIISAFATDLRLLFASIGFLDGTSIGTALSYPAVIATLGEYFCKRRGLAHGVAFSGGSFGGLLFAPIVSVLFTDYGYPGTFVIFAGMTLNILVTGALLRPIQFFSRTEQKEVKIDLVKVTAKEPENKKLLDIKIINSSVLQTENVLLCTLENKSSLQHGTLRADDVPSSYNQNLSPDIMSSSPLLLQDNTLSDGNNQPHTVSQNLGVTLNSSAYDICESGFDNQELKTSDSKKDKCENIKRTLIDKLKASFDVHLFKSLLFPMFLCMAAMLVSSSLLIPVFIAPLGKDVGLSSDQIGLLMSIIGGVGMFSRIMFALFADKINGKLTTLLAVVSTLAGTVAHFARFFTSFPSLVFMSVIIGLCVEIYQSMYPIILVEFLTLPRLKTCVGFTLLCHGIAVAATFPVVGFLRDSTGNYYASYHFLGTMSFAGAAFALSLPYLHRRQQQTEV